MIRVRLTNAMMARLSAADLESAGCRGGTPVPGGDGHVEGAPEAIAILARILDDQAKVLEGVKGAGGSRRTSIAASTRITNAIAKATERSVAPIPISIPVEEQEALRVLAADPGLFVSTPRPLIDRMRRRGLLAEDDDLSARGRAVVAGTPPGDLVPFAFLSSGVRVRLAFDLDPADPQVFQGLHAGHECVIDSAEDGRVWLVTDDGPGPIFLAVERAHPRIFYVVARPKP